MNYRTNNTTTYTFKVDTKNQLTNATPVGNQTYDGNGNVTWSAGTYHAYSYDDENQLVNWYYYESGFNGNGETSDSKDKRTEFIYDGKGRLRKRVEYGSDGSTWTVSSETRYLYDGMRVIQERNSSNTPTVSYTRGSDLSGSLEGAGGIGGLLSRSHGYSAGNWTNHNCYHADGNGNITYLVNSSQTLAASYRYDPYGNTISSSGTLASANVYRFSSKEIHINSGLYYYGYRWYHPNLQRWLNKDPLHEADGINLFLFCRNSPVGLYDGDGRFIGSIKDWVVNKASRTLICTVVVGLESRKHMPAMRYTHCMASCELKKNCGSAAAWTAGLAKELLDLLKCILGDDENCRSAFQPSDFKDNKLGRSCPKEKTCEEQCESLRHEPEAPPGPYWPRPTLDPSIPIY